MSSSKLIVKLCSVFILVFAITKLFSQANDEPSGATLSAEDFRKLWYERTEGKNLALGKEVQFSLVPSYRLTHDDNDAFDLTDGALSKVKNDLIWFGKDAVGWFGGTADSGVNFQVDLGQIENVGKFVIRCLGGEAQRTLSFPKLFEVFVSKDGKDYYRCASMQKLQAAERNLSDFTHNYYLEESGKAYIYPFEFEVNAEARYIAFSIYSYAGGLFSDELAIIEGSPQKAAFNSVYKNPTTPFHISGVMLRPRMDEFVVSTNINTPNFFILRDMRPEELSKNEIIMEIDAPEGLSLISPEARKIENFRNNKGESRVKLTLPMQKRPWSNSQAQPLFFQMDRAVPKNATVTFTSYSESVEAISVELPFYTVEIPKVPKLKRFHVSLAWMGDEDARKWPEYFDAWEVLGFNTIGCFPRFFSDKNKEVRDNFFAEVRQRGYKVLMTDSPIHAMPGKDKKGHEMNCLVPNIVAVCPSYRGTFYQNELERLSRCVQISKPDIVFFDIEAWYNSHITAKTCSRCVEGQKKTGLDVDEYCKQSVGEMMKDFHHAIGEGARIAGIPAPPIGVYGQGAGHIDRSQLVYNWDYYYPQSVKYAQPSLYVGERPWLVHERINKTHKIMKNRDIIPWLTAGTYGEVRPQFIEYNIYEAMLNGSGGFTYYIYSDFDTPMDFYAHAKALQTLAPYEDLILDGEVIDLKCSDEAITVSAIKKDGEMLLLLGNYQKPDCEVSITVPFDKISKIQDLREKKNLKRNKNIKVKIAKSDVCLLYIQGKGKRD